ncbi:hypothetical protein Q7P37_010057 [Cladosporium fusiforme]
MDVDVDDDDDEEEEEEEEEEGRMAFRFLIPNGFPFFFLLVGSRTRASPFRSRFVTFKMMFTQTFEVMRNHDLYCIDHPHISLALNTAPDASATNTTSHPNTRYGLIHQFNLTEPSLQPAISSRQRKRNSALQSSTPELSTLQPKTNTLSSNSQDRGPTTNNMASPFLNKLSPELRCRIYEYVLAFDTPLHHATKLQPFVKKLTGADPKATYKDAGTQTDADSASNIEQSVRLPEAMEMNVGAESNTDSDSDESASSSQLVNTAILTTSKLVYIEAIPIFYKVNTINIKSHLQGLEITPPRATDLSLSKRVIMLALIPPNLLDEDSSDKLQFLDFVPGREVFHGLEDLVIHAYTDAVPKPTIALLSMAKVFRRMYPTTFNGVGSFVVQMRPGVTLVVEYQAMAELFRQPVDPVEAHDAFDGPLNGSLSACRYLIELRRLLRVYEEASPAHDQWAAILKLIRDAMPGLYSDVHTDCDEFFTYLAGRLWP